VRLSIPGSSLQEFIVVHSSFQVAVLRTPIRTMRARVMAVLTIFGDGLRWAEITTNCRVAFLTY
jgi:hypothetical protein